MILKNVTNLLSNIGKCRDIIESRDFKTIYNKIYLFEKTYEDCKRHVDKYTKDPNHALDFTHHDLQELSEEILNYLNNYPQKFKVKNYEKLLPEDTCIDNKVLKEVLNKIIKEMFVDTRLREAYKILSYLAFVLMLWDDNYKNQEFDVQIANTLRELML